MTTQEYLCRHFARMGARVVVRGPRLRQRTKIAIDVGRDRSGEVFVIGCEEEVAIEVLDVQPQSHHLVLMTRDGSAKHKFLLGRDERHWFAAAVPGDGVRDVRTAIASLRPTEIEGREAIRQGEWFFVPEPGVNDKDAVILRNEPLSRGRGSKPHVCAQMMRKGGEAVIEYVEVGIPHPLLQAGMVYVDTPGVADLNRDRVEVTYRFVPRADAVIFVLDSMQAVTDSEIEFLQSTILTNGIERLLFVSNFADLLEVEYKSTAAEKVKNRLASALDRDDLPVVVLSAKEAGSESERAYSGIEELEAQLRIINLDGMRSQEKVAHLRQRLSAIILSAKNDAERKKSSSQLEADALPNAEGGMDVYRDGALQERIIPHGHGAHDVYDSQMQLKATIHPNMQHGHDVLHGGTLLESSIPLGHGATTVLNYSDPLAHLSEYSMTKLVLE